MCGLNNTTNSDVLSFNDNDKKSIDHLMQINKLKEHLEVKMKFNYSRLARRKYHCIKIEMTS